MYGVPGSVDSPNCTASRTTLTTNPTTQGPNRSHLLGRTEIVSHPRGRLITMLIAMSGLPGAGKSALAEELGRLLSIPVLSVDPVEAALWRSGIDRDQPTGLAAYVVVETIAAELLSLGQSVLVDAVNDAAEAREQWSALARRQQVELRYIEVICSDPAIHRRRLEGRQRDIPGFVEPTWESVEARRKKFTTWDEPRLVLDSLDPLANNVASAITYLGEPVPHRAD